MQRFFLFAYSLVCLVFFQINASHHHHEISEVSDSDQIEGITFDCHPFWAGTLEEIEAYYYNEYSSSDSYETNSNESDDENSEFAFQRRINFKTFRLRLPKEIHPEALMLANTHPENENFKTLEEEAIENIISVVERATKATTLNFTAVTLAETLSFPPDSMGAVGPTQFIAFCNGRIKSFNKTTGLPDGVLNLTPNAFFSRVLPSGARTTDPRIRYDTNTKSWVLLIIDIPSSRRANDFLIAITRSQTITAQSVWAFYSFSPSASYGTNIVPFADFPTLGIDVNALYIGANIFDFNGSFVNTAGYVIPKAPLLNLSSLRVTEFPKLLDPTTFVGPLTPQGVDVLDVPNSRGFFIGTDATSFGRLILRYISNPGTTPTISSNIPITVLSTTYPLNVPHLGNNNGVSGYLDAIDDRLSSSHVRKTFLYTSHNIGVNDLGISSPSIPITRDGCRWYKIDISNPNLPTLNQAGTLFQAGNPTSTQERFYWIPSVMTNGLENMILGCSTAGALYHVNAAYVQRFPIDAPGALRAPVLYTQSQTAYNPPQDPGGSGGRRWGDYSHVSLDPSDNMTMWTVQEFCNATNSYGVRAISILAPPPPAISSVSPSIIPNNTNNITVTINGSLTNPEKAYYDPGSSFPNRLKVTITGVTVSSIQVVNRQQLRVVVSTIGSTPGPKTVVITNPDGQSVQASGILTVQ